MVLRKAVVLAGVKNATKRNGGNLGEEEYWRSENSPNRTQHNRRQELSAQVSCVRLFTLIPDPKDQPALFRPSRMACLSTA